MNMSDENIQVPMGRYIQNILKIYKEESNVGNQNHKKIIKTRCGRLVKKPERLDI